MDGKPLQIISIEKGENKKSTYNFKYEALYETISNIYDIEVAVLSISGPSRQGKSFLLSYLLRYLSNPNDNNWIGKDDEPLKGFEWNHGIEPETKGIWIWSKPIIVKQAIGKEIAIIIIDTQGVYDEYTDLRDWSTIVGITLLTSSCFIYNVFTDIQEIVLTQLETFVNYGLLAMSKDETNNHAFQRLLFLIRDWNHARDFGYGHKGGKEYITQKLSIKSNQPQASQRTRELIRNCFEDVTCYLMPEIGAQRDEQDFNGSVSQLNPKFVAKLRELFLVLLSPESLKPKIINGNTITGRDLIKYFEVFVDKFNGDQLPQPMDLVEAVAKATDFNLIYKLKESFIFEMNKELQTKHFVSRYELEVFYKRISADIIKAFQTLKKSQNHDIVKQIIQMFETELRNAYKKIYVSNEERREKIANDTITKCINIYCESMDHSMTEKNFVKGHTFDSHSQHSKKLAMEYFAKIFGDEQIDSFAPYLLKIYKSIEENENSFKIENYKRKSESKKINAQAINDSLTLYNNQIKALLDENVFLTPEKFNQCEQEIRVQSSELFINQCNGDKDSVKKFEDLLGFRLNEAKSELENLNRNKMKETMNNTELALNLALNNCKEKLIESLELFTGSEDLKIINSVIKQNTIDMFEHKCIVKDANFISPYSKKLESEIEKIFDKFIKDFESKCQDLKDFYNQSIAEAMDRCFVQIENLFEVKSLISNEELDSFRKKLISDVINKYENVPKNGKLTEIKDYVNERTASAADLLLIDKLIEIYSEKMTETLVTKIFFARQELSRLHNENSEKVIEIFNVNKKTVNSQILNQISAQFNDNLNTIFEEYYSRNEQNRERYVDEEIENSFSLYKQYMNQTLDHVCVESHRFEELNSDSKMKALKNLNDFCSEEKELNEFYTSKLTKLIDFAEKEIKTGNDIKICEAKRKNCEAVNESLNYYSNKMSSALTESLFHSKESFKRYENNLREEANKIFIDNCKYGEIEFINKFELDLDNKIKHLKSKYKTSFRKNMDALESEIIIKINNSLSQYNQVMYHLLDALHSEQQFSSKHNELKANVINEFKQKCLLKDSQYKDQQILKLENAINDSRNQFHDRLLSQIKKSGNFYEKSINESFDIYVKLMKELFSDNTSISEEELKNLHQNVVKDILSQFENTFENEDDIAVIESNRRTLEIKIMNEFDSIMRTNRTRNDSNERSDMKLKLEIKDYVDEYEERMEKMIPFCGSQNDLMEQHFEIENIIKEKMLISSPFSNPNNLEPYLTKLEVEINKSFKDFNVIFKVNLDKQLLSLQNVIMNARKFYREEMDKYYSETNFLKPENLINYNNGVTDRTIAKYQSERGNMSIEKFNILIKDSLKDIYNDIVVENDKNTPTLPAIGIDLGTTNSCVAYYQPSKPKGITIIVPNDIGNRTTPSVVAFSDNNEEMIGEAAKEQSYRNSRNTIYSAKRLIGRQFDDETVQKDMLLWPFRVVDDGYNIAKISVRVDGNDKVFFPEEISAKILKKLKLTAENHLGCEVRNAVITVPAYFNEAQKEATIDAGKIAGLNVLKIINEPTAAAIAFQLNRNDESGFRKVLIYDFGGGTLDVVVLSIERGIIDIIAVGGDNHLGGDDIDAILVEYCLSAFTQNTQIQIDRKSEEGENALRRLTTECEKRKRQLCATNKAEISVDHFYNGQDLRCELTRQKFEQLNNNLFVKSTDLVAQVLCDAHFDHSDIDDVVLVGGTTRIPKIQEMLSDLFYGKPLNHSVNPDEAVAVGAAIQAAILNGTLAQNAGLLRVSDVTPMSLGVKVKDGFMSVIIHRNSKVPNKYTKQYETTTDNQREVDIEIYEGEETFAEDNRKLGTFTLSNIPPGIAGEQQIEVTFNINDEGLLHVSAKIMSNGEEEEIVITEHKGRLTNAELQILIEQENQ